MKAVSLNGPDGSGKSQQLRLLDWQFGQIFHATKPLICYSQRWPNCTGYESSRWWFETVAFEELVDIIIESLNVRQRDYPAEMIPLHDRGSRMFRAVCTATMMTREDTSFAEASGVVNNLFAAKLDQGDDECEVVLQPSHDYFSQIVRFVEMIRPSEGGAFPISAKERYRRYQQHLAQAMSAYFATQPKHLIIVDRPVLEIQNEIRSVLNSEFPLDLPSVGQGLSTIVGFGGLSECGKSSFAEHLRTKHAFCRLKLRYFIESLERRRAAVSPEAICLELLNYFETHYYLQHVSIESLHDPYVPAMMKLLFGHRMRIVFIQTEHVVRVSRAANELGLKIDEAEHIVAEKDLVKIGRGAERVRDIADLIFDNSADDHEANLQDFASSIGVPAP